MDDPTSARTARARDQCPRPKSGTTAVRRQAPSWGAQGAYPASVPCCAGAHRQGGKGSPCADAFPSTDCGGWIWWIGGRTVPRASNNPAAALARQGDCPVLGGDTCGQGIRPGMDADQAPNVLHGAGSSCGCLPTPSTLPRLSCPCSAPPRTTGSSQRVSWPIRSPVRRRCPVGPVSGGRSVCRIGSTRGRRSPRRDACSRRERRRCIGCPSWRPP